MGYKYQSNYTGKEIDYALRKLLDGSISIDDFSPELIETIQGWVGDGVKASKELVFGSHLEFPVIGEPNKLYIATNEPNLYFWNGSNFVVIGGIDKIPQIDLIDCGGAKENGRE